MSKDCPNLSYCRFTLILIFINHIEKHVLSTSSLFREKLLLGPIMVMGVDTIRESHSLLLT